MVKKFYPLEYYIANGIIDYIIVVIIFSLIIFFNVSQVPASLNYFSTQKTDFMKSLVLFVVSVVLLLTFVLWPVLDLFLVFYLFHWVVYLLAYIFIRLIVLIFYHENVYDAGMDLIGGILDLRNSIDFF